MGTPRPDGIPVGHPCPDCGTPVLAGERACAGCGRLAEVDPRGRGWRPRAVPAPGQQGQPVPPAGPRPAGGLRSGKAVVEGQMRGLQQRTEGAEARVEVWSFRVERFDSAGNRIMVLPVEVRGVAIEGAVADGDWVRAAGSVRAGTLRAREVVNLSTGATVTPASAPRWFGIAVVVLMLVIVVVGVVLTLLTLHAFALEGAA